MARRPSTSPADSAGEPIYTEGSDSAANDDLSPIELDLGDEGDDEPVVNNGVSSQEMDDGGVELNFDPQVGADMDPSKQHDINLATFLDPMTRNELAARVIQLVKDDKDSRAEWEGTLADGLKLLGTKFEDRTFPFKGASGVTDPMMMEAVVKWVADSYGELLPAGGPVKTKVAGMASEALDAQASRVKEWMNLYLTDLAPEYYPDYLNMLFWLGLAGSTFKKVYPDPISGRPLAPYIRPDHFIVNYDAKDIFSCQRMTHVSVASKAEMRSLQLAGVWLETGVTAPQDTEYQNSILQQEVDSNAGTQRTQTADPESYDIYETHMAIDLKGFEHKISGLDGSNNPSGLPLPYRITIDVQNVKILSIYRNWKEGDPTYERVQMFVHYKLMPGAGFYGYGYAHVLGGSTKAATAIRRQIIDASTLNMFPGGLRQRGMRMEDNNLMIGPCQFIEIDTGGMPIQQAIMPMPYKEPSQVSLAMLQETYQAGERLSSTTEIATGDGSQNAPVGTTLALLEAAMKVTSMMVKAAHQSFRQELKLIAALFGKSLPDTPYPFQVRGGQMTIMRADFSDQIDIIPVSDPNITSSSQRIIVAQTKLQMALQAPQIHDLKAAYRQMYVAMSVPEEEIGALLPPQQQAVPMDPLSENMAAVQGAPLKAGLMQDHEAHIAVHKQLASLPNMQAHIAEHIALNMRVQVEQKLGIQLPPAGAQLPPQVENQIAMLVAKAMQMITEPNGPEPSQTQLALMDLQTKAKKVEQQYQVDMGKLQLGAMKQRMTQQDKDADRESREKIEEIRAAANIADNQTPPPPYVKSIMDLGNSERLPQ